MKCRSPGVTVKPCPAGAGAASAVPGRIVDTATDATSATRNSIADSAAALWIARHQNRGRKGLLFRVRRGPDMVGPPNWSTCAPTHPAWATEADNAAAP